MCRKILFYLLFILVVSNSFSQNTFDFVGGLKLNDSTLISYKVNFIEDRGEIRGYSLTDLGGVHETRSNIYGKYDKEKRELTYKETDIVYTKTPLEKGYEFCFVNVVAKGFVLGRSKMVKTKFFGSFLDGVECISGDLFLNSVAKVEARMSKVVKKINKSKRIADSIKQKINPLKMMDSLSMNILRRNQTLSVFSKYEKVNLTIYDGGKEDGDQITIFVNGKVLLKKYKGSNSKKIVDIELTEDKTSIVIEANNEGLIAPNTIVVEINDGQNDIKALSNLKVNETTQIDILKRK